MTIVELTKSLVVPAELVIGCSRLTSRSTRSTHLSTRSTYLPAFSIRSNRLSIRSTRLFAGSLRLSTRNTCLSIRLSTHSTRLSTRSTYLSSFSIKNWFWSSLLSLKKEFMVNFLDFLTFSWHSWWAGPLFLVKNAYQFWKDVTFLILNVTRCKIWYQSLFYVWMIIRMHANACKRFFLPSCRFYLFVWVSMAF